MARNTRPRSALLWMRWLASAAISASMLRPTPSTSWTTQAETTTAAVEGQPACLHSGAMVRRPSWRPSNTAPEERSGEVLEVYHEISAYTSGCIYWVPREAVRTIEYVSQAEEYQPFLGSKRKILDVRGGKTNFDPIKGYQVWWPVEEGLRLFEGGSLCPEDPVAAAGALGLDERVAAAWEELPAEARAKALDVLATASQE